MITVGGLFSGIGGIELGLQWAGFEHAWMCEADPWCRTVLAKNFPGVELYNDVRTLGAAAALRRPDVLAGGFPCQDVSSAGKGEGLGGARSGLWFEFLRLVEELRPAAVIVENVASGKKKWLAQVRAGLESAGYRTRPLGIRACDVGAPHLRARIFVIAVADTEGAGRNAGWADAASGGDVSDASSEGREGSGPALAKRWPGSGIVAGGAEGGALPDPDRGRCQGIGSGGLFDREWPALGDHADRCDGSDAVAPACPQPGLGGAPDGIPARLDGPAAAPRPPRSTRWAWPTGRGQDQAAWEAPRLIPRPPRGTNRRPRLKALGNAVVPQCAYLVGLALIDWMAEMEANAASQ